MDYKKAFYSKLEECYLGAKIKAYEKAHTAQKIHKAIQVTHKAVLAIF